MAVLPQRSDGPLSPQCGHRAKAHRSDSAIGIRTSSEGLGQFSSLDNLLADRYHQIEMGSCLEFGRDICSGGMMRARAWRMRRIALAVIALIAGTGHLGAQDRTTHDRRTTVSSSSPHSPIRTHFQLEFESISWDQLLKDMKAELKVNEPDIDRVHDGPRRSVLSIVCLGKTEEKHGLLRLAWDQRKIRRIELFEVGENTYLVVRAEEYVEVKARLGEWRLDEELSGGWIQSPSVGQVITGEFP